MKLSTTLSALLLSSAALFIGCDSSSNETEAKNYDISGYTTLSKGYVCIDSNSNLTCDEGETQVQTNEDGSYNIERSEALAEGTQLFAEDGKSLLDGFENNLDRVKYTASYRVGEAETNINAMTSFIAARLANGESYSDAIASLASKYGLDSSILTANPLDHADNVEVQKLFLALSEIEKKKFEQEANNVASAKFRVDENSTSGEVITEEEADSFLDGFDFDFEIIREYSFKIENYFLDLKNYTINYLDKLYNDVIVDGCYWDDNCSVDKNLPREALNGVWYMFPLHACIEIDPQDNINLVSNDVNETYTLYYREYNSDFTLLKGWREQGLVEIIKNEKFYEEDNDFTRLSIAYDIKETNASQESNETVGYYMAKQVSMQKCTNILNIFN